MRFTTAFTLASATLAAAAPAPAEIKAANAFSVDKFVFGCTVGCNYSFRVANYARGPNHPAVTKAVECAGSLDSNDYQDCGAISKTQAISAYISKADNILHLRYTVSNPKAGSLYHYYGDQKVYAATSANASLQKSAFTVPETRADGVA